MTYLILDASNQVVQVPIQTWGDSCYVLFGQAQRDLVNRAHQAMQAVQLQFNQKKEAPFDHQAAVLPSLDHWIAALEPEIGASVFWMKSIDEQEAHYNFKFEEMSQLLSLTFWGTMIAYVINTIALKIWDWIDGTSQKAAELTIAIRIMDGDLRETKVPLGGEYQIGVSFPFMDEGNCYQAPIAKFAVNVSKDDTMAFYAERLFNNGSKIVLESQALRDPSIDASQLTMHALLVTLDLDKTALADVNLQLMIAVNLAKREDCPLILKLNSDHDLTSYGMVAHQDDYLSWPATDDAGQMMEQVYLWRLERFQDAWLEDVSGEEVSGEAYFQNFDFFGGIDKDRRFFGDRLLAERHLAKPEAAEQS